MRNEIQDLIDRLNDWANNFPRLDKEEEKRLVSLAQQGDNKARDMIHKSNFKYNIKVAYRLARDEFFVADAILESLIWFNKGINRFNVSRKNNLLTYASWWSRQGVRRYLNKNAKFFRLPENKISLSNKIAKIYSQEFCLNGSYPSVDKIVDIINEEIEDEKKRVEASVVRELLSFILFLPISLDSKVNLQNGATVSLANILPDTKLASPEELLQERDRRNFLYNKLFSCLNKRERKVMSWYHGLKIKKNKEVVKSDLFTIEQIADKMGIRSKSAYNIKYSAMKKMKKRSKQLGTDLLKEVL